MSEARWASIIPHVAEFQRHLALYTPRIEIDTLNCRRWSDDEYRLQLKTRKYDQIGVYLMFDLREQLEYVGLAIQAKGFHGRIWDHDAELERLYTDIIAFPPAFRFLAPALECFLICRLHPPKNTTYRGYEIPDLPS